MSGKKRESYVGATKEEAKQQGKVIVNTYFISALREVANAKWQEEKKSAQERLERAYEIEALNRFGVHKTREEAEADLRHAVQPKSLSDFVDSRMAMPGFGSGDPRPTTGDARHPRTALVADHSHLQGEGVELDLQRRRHPMWEWPFSHPVRPGAVFLAEMLSPVASNPAYTTAPIFFAVLFFHLQPRSWNRSRDLHRRACSHCGRVRWKSSRDPDRAGLSATIAQSTDRTELTRIRCADVVCFCRRGNGDYRFPGPSVCDRMAHFRSGRRCSWWSLCAVMIAAGVRFSVWGAQRGLAGSAATKTVRPSKRVYRVPLLHKDPFNRKEILWFIRDRGATAAQVSKEISSEDDGVFKTIGRLAPSVILHIVYNAVIVGWTR